MSTSSGRSTTRTTAKVVSFGMSSAVRVAHRIQCDHHGEMIPEKKVSFERHMRQSDACAEAFV
jgi:hypothetical protein